MKESRYNIWVERGKDAYVFNGVSGALLRVSKSDHAALQQYLAGNKDSGCSPQFLLRLVNGQMLVSDDGDELALLGKRYHMNRHDASRFALTIVTSLGCNFDCPYCFEAKHPSLMDKDVQDAVLQVVDDQLPRIHNFDVMWFGGEPLVGKQSLLALSDAFIARCDSVGVDYRADIATNGYLLDEETCSELRDRRVGHAQVCLDGPPDVHNRMRPLAGGKNTFGQIVRNLHHAVKYLEVSVRMNVDRHNFPHTEQLLQILADEGLAGKLTVYPGQIMGLSYNPGAPSARLSHQCFTKAQFAQAEMEFTKLTARYGFGQAELPQPTGAPCTAVRANELVVGSKGELYKCWESVGNEREVIGHIRDYQNPNGRLAKWLTYDPFSNSECRSCIALPVCMGGCAHHAMDILQYENRCGTFRHNYREHILMAVTSAEEQGCTEIASPRQLISRMEPR
jgi:uncharacterized protein